MHNLLPGRTLYFLATGTGLAAFMGPVREPDIYERFDRVVLIHGVRRVAELAYRDFLGGGLRHDEYVGDLSKVRFTYCPTVTREPFARQGRITNLLANGNLQRELGLAPLDPASDRLVLCGSTAMLANLSHMLETGGFNEGSNAKPGDFVAEKAFAERITAIRPAQAG